MYKIKQLSLKNTMMWKHRLCWIFNKIISRNSEGKKAPWFEEMGHRISLVCQMGLKSKKWREIQNFCMWGAPVSVAPVQWTSDDISGWAFQVPLFPSGLFRFRSSNRKIRFSVLVLAAVLTHDLQTQLLFSLSTIIHRQFVVLRDEKRKHRRA